MTAILPSPNDPLSIDALRRVVDCCELYETARRAGDEPSIESILATVEPDLRSTALCELIAVECEYRRATDRPPTLVEYSERFPAETVAVERAFGYAPGPVVPEPPQEFGGYRLLGRIGSGGMGTVYRAVQTAAGRVVALKVIKPELLAELPARAREELTRRFLVEARAAASLTHENIVTVYDVGQEGGWHFYSMRLIEGTSLRRHLDEGPLPPRRAAELAAVAARALHAAHGRGIIHRDLKPGNILLDSAMKPHIADFGLARIIDADDARTLTQGAVGTPAYISPEQAEGRPVTARSDVYSLGATLYECLAGRPPFAGATPIEILGQLTRDLPESIRARNPAVPRDLETVCLKCLSKEPGDRYATMAELADDLENCLADRPIRGRTPGFWKRQRPRWRANRERVLAIGGMLVLSAVLGLSLFATRPDSVAETAPPAENGDAAMRGALKQCEDGYLAKGLFALADAQRDPEQPPELRDGIRQNVAAWLGAMFTVEGIYSHSAQIRIAELSPDGRWVAVGDAEGRVALWDVRGAKIHGLYDGTTGEILSIAFSGDGKKIAAASYGGSVSIWTIDAPPASPKIILLGPAVYGIAFTADGDLVTGTQYTGSETIRFWNADTLKERLILRDPEWGRIKVGKFIRSPDRRSLLVRGSDDSAELWDLDTATRRYRLDGDGKALVVKSAAFSPDSMLFATGGSAVRIWTPQSNRPASHELTENHNVLGFSPDGTAVAVQSPGLPPKLWQRFARCFDPIRTPRLAGIATDGYFGKYRLAIEADRTFVLYRWPRNSPAALPLDLGDEKVLRGGHFSPAGDRVAMATGALHANAPATLELWAPFDGNRLLESIRVPASAVGSVSFASKTELAFTANGRIFSVDPTSSRREEFRLPHTDIAFMRALPRRKKWVTWSYDNAVVLRGGPDSEDFDWRIESPTRIACVSPDEKWLAIKLLSQNGRHRIAVVDLNIGSVARMATVELPPKSLWFTADSRRIIAVGTDRRMKSWDVATLEPVPFLPAATEVVDVIAAATGEGWITGHEDGSVKWWPSSQADAPARSWSPDEGHSLVGLGPAGVTSVTRSTTGSDVRIWSLPTRAALGPPISIPGPVSEVQWGNGTGCVVRSGKTARAFRIPDAQSFPDESRIFHELSFQTGMSSTRLLTAGDWRTSRIAAGIQP